MAGNPLPAWPIISDTFPFGGIFTSMCTWSRQHSVSRISTPFLSQSILRILLFVNKVIRIIWLGILCSVIIFHGSVTVAYPLGGTRGKTRLQSFYLLALFCGLRASEVCRIKADKHVGLEADTIEINRTGYYVDEKTHTRPTKSTYSQGAVYLPDELTVEVKKLQRIHKEKQLFFGKRWVGSPTLINGTCGDPMCNGNLWE